MAQKSELSPSQDNIHYTSINRTVAQFNNDPYGNRVINFLEQAYGITDPIPLLKQAGMGEYLDYKTEGRFIGLFASQVLKPSFYNLTSAVVLGELAKQGLPSALMIFEYPQDVFNPRNIDKVKAMGPQNFWLDGRTVQLKLNPIGTAISPLPIYNVNQLANVRCDQILTQAIQPIGPANQPYFNSEQTFLSAALGLDIPPIITLTDFYKTLWLASIDRLRRNGVLPDEETLPMFFVDMVQLYTTLAQAAPDKFTIKPDGMVKSASYYPVQVAWPDLYLEDSGGSGVEFEANIVQAQQIRHQHGLPEVQVRVPYRETPDLDKYMLHPTGRITDLSTLWTSRNSELQELGKNRQTERLNQVLNERNQAHFERLKSHSLADDIKDFPVTFPSSVSQVYQSIIQGDL